MRLPLALISLDFRPEQNLTVEIVQAYVSRFQRKERVEPVTVYSDGFSFWLFDGFHRAKAAAIAGVLAIEVKIVPGTFEDMEACRGEGLQPIQKVLRVKHGMRFDSTHEQRNVVLVDVWLVAKAEKLVFGCEGCSPENAKLTFVDVLHRITGNDSAVTDYIFVKAIPKCPQCRREIAEKTLVEIL